MECASCGYFHKSVTKAEGVSSSHTGSDEFNTSGSFRMQSSEQHRGWAERLHHVTGVILSRVLLLQTGAKIELEASGAASVGFWFSRILTHRHAPSAAANMHLFLFQTGGCLQQKAFTSSATVETCSVYSFTQLLFKILLR